MNKRGSYFCHGWQTSYGAQPFVRKHFREVAAKCPENKQKSQRNHWKINRDLSKAMYFKGKVQTKFKSTQHVWQKTSICQNIASWGVPPPHESAIIFWQIPQIFTHFAQFLSTFELSLWNPLVFLGFSWFSVDFSMISVAFLLIFRTFCSDFAEDPKNTKIRPWRAPIKTFSPGTMPRW